MTNREWLFNMTDEELAIFFTSQFWQGIFYGSTNTRIGLQEWFKRDCKGNDECYDKTTGFIKYVEIKVVEK